MSKFLLSLFYLLYLCVMLWQGVLATAHVWMSEDNFW